MSMRHLVAALPADFILTLVDVGSAGGVHRRWQNLRPLLSAILFDPREAAANGVIGRGGVRLYPVALGREAGEADLHITALANMSSLLRPDPDVFGRYRKKGADARVVGTETVLIDTLDAVAEADGFTPHVIKVDTQGSELMVLAGAESSLQSVVLAEIEVSFFERYVGQPLFADVEAWMKARGFEMIELQHLKRYRAANSLGIRRPPDGDDQRSGRVAYGDAIFLRHEAAILAAARQDSGLTILRAVVALVAYGKVDHAAALLDRGRDLIRPEIYQDAGEALTALNRRRFISELGGVIQRARGRG